MKLTKHIVWLCPGFASDEADDSCIPSLQLFLTEIEQIYPDYKISIIAFQYPYKTKPYKLGNTHVFPINGKNKTGITRLFIWLRVWNTFKRINREIPVEVVHSFWFSECMFIGKLLSSFFKISHINTLMGQDVLPSNRYLKKYFLKRVATIALCERHANTFKQNTGYDPIAVIPWGIDKSVPVLNASKEYDIIAVGSLIPLKRYNVLINVIAELKKTFPDIKVLLVGDGPERKRLEEQSQTVNISENIIFAGNQKRASVMKLMSKSAIFVHTSEYESFGFVFLEAMKSGLSVVSFPVGIAEETNNWVVVHSEKEMVNELTELLNNKSILFSSIPFSISATAEKYIDLYKR